MKAIWVLLAVCVATCGGEDTSQNYAADEDVADLSTWSPQAIQITPHILIFGEILPGEVKKMNVNILNLGGSNLRVTGFQFSGNQCYSLSVAADEYPISQETTEGIAFDTLIVIEPDSQYFFKVRFAPIDDQKAEATLVVFSNDPKNPETTVLVEAN